MNLIGRNINILFVSCSNEDVRFALKQLGKTASNVTWYTAGTEKEFKETVSSFDPGIVMADCARLSFNLLDLLEITRLHIKAIPVILLADKQSEDIAIEGLESGAYDYVLRDHMKRLPFAVDNALNASGKNMQHPVSDKESVYFSEAFQNLLQKSKDAVFLIRNHKLDVVNSEFKSIFELSDDDFLKRPFDFIQLAAPENRSQVEEVFCSLPECENILQRFEFTAITKSGSRKEVDATVTYCRVNGDEVVQGIVRDVTRGKDIEKSLIKSEQKFRRIFYNHSAVKLIVDPDSGNILDANLAAAAFYGWPVEKLQQMNVSEINFLSQHAVTQKMDEVKSDHNTFSEYRQLNARGEVIDVEVFSSTVDYEGKEVLHFIVHDITSRKEAENRLHLLNYAVEQNPVAIVITDPEGKIEYVNSEFTLMTGYTFNDIAGQSLQLLKSGYQSEEFYNKFWTTITSGSNWEGEFKNRKKNGEMYWQESSISPILDDDGAISHYVAVLEDITEKKKMIEDLVEAKEKAEESDRLKSAFLANMSHEIRTPMNGIIGFTELLKEQKLTGKEKDVYIEIIRKSGERMLNTINDLIEISQIESRTIDLHTSDVNINEVIDNYYHQFLKQSAAKGLELTCHKDLPDTQALIQTDGKKLNSVFVNLLKNAIKYTASGRIDYGYVINNNNIEFYVKDTGIGIEVSRQEIIFDRFVQADMSMTKPYEGAGLGLSIAKAYVEMMGGTIWVESEPGKGTEFHFTIPFTGKPFHLIKGLSFKKENNDAEFLSNLSILVAEDDVVGKLYLSELLEDECRKVWFASDGIEALEFFKENHQNIDVVLMDIKMPGMNGYETAQKMKEISSNVFIIAQTAYALSGDREKAYRSGCDYYISKPFSKTQLIEAIKKFY